MFAVVVYCGLDDEPEGFVEFVPGEFGVALYHKEVYWDAAGWGRDLMAILLVLILVRS